MPVKNRLAELQKASKHVTDKDIKALETENAESIPLQTSNMSDSCAEFFHNFQEVIEDIDKVGQNVSTIRHLHSKILYDFREDPQHKARLEDLMEENKRLGVRIRRALKDEQDKLDEKAMKELKENLKEDTKTKKKPANHAKKQHELRLRKTQLTTQTKRFCDIWEQYNKEQCDYRQVSKDVLVKRLRTAGSNLSEEEVEDLIDQGKADQIFSQSYLEQTAMAKKQLTELQDRHEEFLKLERSIREVHELFMELQAMVSQQGEVVDSIFHHVERATIDVEKGKEQLQKAEEHKKKARKLKLIIACILAIVILIVVLVIASELGAFGNDNSSLPPPPTTTKAPTSSTSTTTANSNPQVDDIVEEPPIPVEINDGNA